MYARYPYVGYTGTVLGNRREPGLAGVRRGTTAGVGDGVCLLPRATVVPRSVSRKKKRKKEGVPASARRRALRNEVWGTGLCSMGVAVRTYF